eukprot:GILI01033360.1.p1 GENE.GILI01033360.1~~GILI01033360.1.p1  ORF type:complete len:339 (-),score=79.39 GILI01033360.1:61-993(-)
MIDSSYKLLPGAAPPSTIPTSSSQPPTPSPITSIPTPTPLQMSVPQPPPTAAASTLSQLFMPFASQVPVSSSSSASSSESVPASSAIPAVEFPAFQLSPLSNPRAGCLLLAHPLMTEDFSRSVILIHSHSEEKGTVGLVLNAPLRSSLREQLNQRAKSSLERLMERPVLWGGPVNTPWLECLSNAQLPIESSSIAPGLNKFMIAKLKEALAANPETPIPESQLQFLSGQASWTAGQLKYELSQGYWFLADLPSPSIDLFDLVYKDMPPAHVINNNVASEWKNTVWKRFVKAMGGEYSYLTLLPILAPQLM